MFCKQMVEIKTKVKDDQVIKDMVKPIIEFSERHDIVFYIGVDSAGELLATYEACGKTSAYCKGMVAEIKQMLKDVFQCKINVVVYAY